MKQRNWSYAGSGVSMAEGKVYESDKVVVGMALVQEQAARGTYNARSLSWYAQMHKRFSGQAEHHVAGIQADHYPGGIDAHVEEGAGERMVDRGRDGRRWVCQRWIRTQCYVCRADEAP